MPFIVLIITMSTGYGLTTYMIVRGGQTRFHGLAGFGLVHFFCTKLEVEIRFVKGNELLPLTGLKRFPPGSILHAPNDSKGNEIFWISDTCCHPFVFQKHSKFNLKERKTVCPFSVSSH
jgi:hypothetical protein